MEYEIKSENKLSLNIQELWNYKELFYFFTWRDVKVKYKQTALGFVWAVIQPTMMMLVIALFFGKTIGDQPGMALPYPVFVYLGLILWGIFSGGLQSAGNSMVSNANIIKKIYFPRLIIPMSSVLVSLFDFIMALLPLIPLLLYYNIEADWLKLFLLIPLSITIILLTTLGVGCLLAALNVKYRDFRYVIPFIIQFLLFATPVIYPITVVENPTLQFILRLNPISTGIDLCRSVFEPSMSISWTSTAYGFFVACLLFVVGIFYFRKTEAYFADLA